MARRRSLMVAAAVVAVVVGGAATFGWFRYAPRTTPSGQPPLAHITDQTVGDFLRSFNAEAGKTRLLVMLSPS